MTATVTEDLEGVLNSDSASCEMFRNGNPELGICGDAAAWKGRQSCCEGKWYLYCEKCREFWSNYVSVSLCSCHTCGSLITRFRWQRI